MQICANVKFVAYQYHSAASIYEYNFGKWFSTFVQGMICSCLFVLSFLKCHLVVPLQSARFYIADFLVSA